MQGYCEPDLHVFAKLFEDRLERGLEAQAFSRREIGGDDDVLNFFVGHLRNMRCRSIAGCRPGERGNSHPRDFWSSFVRPAKAGVFSRDQTCRGKSQTPRSLDGRVEGEPEL